MNLRCLIHFFFGTVFLTSVAYSQDYVPDRCELLPLPDQQVSFQIDGVEKTRWHFDEKYPRPFFYPFNGPSGVSLTRMGHPGAQNHDHHRSVWFAHHDIGGVDFWSDNTEGKVRQKYWYRYRDGNDECVMASITGWYDGEGKELMEQDVVAALRPLEGSEHELEIQITMRPPANAETVELGKTNFGFLAVRVSKTLSKYFGGGNLTNSEGLEGEEAIFGKQARWMDYSGPVVVGTGPDRQVVTEGITYFDHPENPRYPTHWHVRSDGWMGASFCFAEGYTITKEEPLVLRYLLHAHAGDYDSEKATAIAESFSKRPGFEVGKSDKPHRQYDVWRIGSD
ncbi:MAG: PmoA family protein [Verrucomicrobiae bacterium]|nr:PmoA family protein [Verrucomicrobiae bacterium]